MLQARSVRQTADPAAADPDLDSARRARVEWVIASGRVVLAAGVLLAVILDPLERVEAALLIFLLGCYLVHSVAVMALVWSPIQFGRGWGLAVHLFDYAAFSVLILVTQGGSSPLFICFIFLLVCGTLRWQVRGALWTAAAAFSLNVGLAARAALAPDAAGFELNAFVIRCVYLAVVTFLLAYLSAHQHRFQHEIARIAAWPRRISRDPRETIAEVLAQSAALLEAPRLVLAWQEPGRGGVSLAWTAADGCSSSHDPDLTWESLVHPALSEKCFETPDAGQPGVPVVTWGARGLRRHRCRPVHEALQTRFAIRAVQSWPLRGELVNARLFALDRKRAGMDDLIFGELVANVAASHMESMHLLGRLRDAAALEERVRVAHDLHDSLLQSQAGAALQLLAARRLLARDAATASRRLKDVQDQLERGELEMRCFIRDLRPAGTVRGERNRSDLTSRLEDLRRTVERQWEVRVQLDVPGPGVPVPPEVEDDVYRLAREALVNAARHSEASAIGVSLDVAADEVRLQVVDDGRGFPFHGTYDLAALNTMDEGPLTLRERVAQLAGTLTLASMHTGTTVRMTIPVAQGRN